MSFYKGPKVVGEKCLGHGISPAAKTAVILCYGCGHVRPLPPRSGPSLARPETGLADLFEPLRKLHNADLLSDKLQILAHLSFMQTDYPDSLPDAHRSFIDRTLRVLPDDSRILELAAAGSYLTGMGRFSDLDLIVVTEPGQQDEVLSDRITIARKLGAYLEGFTGEHVGEPRLLITLYGTPLLHVDLKFVSLADVHVRVEEPFVLWQRDGRVSPALSASPSAYPQPDIAWIDKRFWIWMHYALLKIGRREIFEAIDMINFVRSNVLGPLALRRAGAWP